MLFLILARGDYAAVHCFRKTKIETVFIEIMALLEIFISINFGWMKLIQLELEACLD